MNVKLNESPLFNWGELIFSGPSDVVTVCGASSMFVHVTVSPGFTVSESGE